MCQGLKSDNVIPFSVLQTFQIPSRWKAWTLFHGCWSFWCEVDLLSVLTSHYYWLHVLKAGILNYLLLPTPCSFICLLFLYMLFCFQKQYPFLFDCKCLLVFRNPSLKTKVITLKYSHKNLYLFAHNPNGTVLLLPGHIPWIQGLYFCFPSMRVAGRVSNVTNIQSLFCWNEIQRKQFMV